MECACRSDVIFNPCHIFTENNRLLQLSAFKGFQLFHPPPPPYTPVITDFDKINYIEIIVVEKVLLVKTSLVVWKYHLCGSAVSFWFLQSSTLRYFMYMC